MSPRSWFFQANPDVNRIRDALQELDSLTWVVKQHPSEIHPGDEVYIWESGSSGGLLSIAQVTSEPYMHTEAEDDFRFYISPPSEGPELVVDLAIDRLYSQPLTRTELQAEPALAKNLLVTNPRGTNFPIATEEATVLQSLLASKPNVLKAKTMTNSFWWVNQGQTYAEEKKVGVVWAPQAGAGSDARFHWKNVAELRVGDIIFHYANGTIVAVSRCTVAGRSAEKPDELKTEPKGLGWMADTSFFELPHPIPIGQVGRPIRKLGLKYGPINKNDKGNQGYMFALTPAAARIVAEHLELSELPEDIADSLRLLIATQWDAFVHWAKRFWEDSNIREVERVYKIDVGTMLASSYSALKSGGDWLTPLRKSFQGVNNLTDYRSHDPFLKWCKDSPEAAKDFLQTIWNPDVDGATAVGNGLASLPKEIVSGPGIRNNIATFIAMERDPTHYPIYKPTPFEDGTRLMGYPSFHALSEDQYYGHALGFLDRIVAESASRGLELKDRLDAQSILWCVTKYEPPESWPEEERQAFLAFRGGEETAIIDSRDLVDPLQALASSLFVDVEFLQEVELLIGAKQQVIFYGPPGTGKTYVAKSLAKHFARTGGQVEIVQFHPSYAYEDFVEGFRPTLTDGQAGFQLTGGPLRRLAAKARKHPSSTFVLLIDEINRGNVAKVFGELYFLLEYRDEEISLQYSRKRFAMPPNLWIIGTMNTADRSIALVDAALRRRFYFIPFFPDEAPVSSILERWLAANKPEFSWLADVVAAANKKLGDRHSAIGPSYFMIPDLDERWLGLIWKHAILPYLAEQFFGDQERIKEFELDKLCKALSASSPED